MPVSSGSVCAESPPAVASQVWRWPRRWADQHPLLERQHDALEGLLAELLRGHGPAQGPWSAAEALAYEGACRRLIWDLRLHLRLEERWLSGQGCLCPGHRAVHGQAIREAMAALLRTNGDRKARLRWLLELQAWFIGHRNGPDATAYATATTNANPVAAAR
jgi:hemerythrin